MNIDALRNFNADRMSIEELVALSAFAKNLQAEFVTYSIDAPAWVSDQSRALSKEIKSRNFENLSAQLKEKKARLEALATPDQKREKLAKEIEDLQAQLQ
jgi:hypothetical protein